jgi:hypothetical protein
MSFYIKYPTAKGQVLLFSSRPTQSSRWCLTQLTCPDVDSKHRIQLSGERRFIQHPKPGVHVRGVMVADILAVTRTKV